MGSAKTRPTADETFVQDLVWQTPKPASGWLLPVRALRLLLRICRRDLSTIFGFTYNHDRFGSIVSASGKGSDLIQTAIIREALPGLLRELNVTSMLDAPCGDFYWMRYVDLPATYIGMDIVRELVRHNEETYGGRGKTFMEGDLTSDALPQVDLVLCRDCLVHLSLRMAKAAIQNIAHSGAKYLLATTFPATTRNKDIISGGWRPLNLQLPPFSFPKPVRLINENCTQQNGRYPDKSLGLWSVDEITPLVLRKNRF